MTKVAVFGAGSWGTAFAIVLAEAGNQVSVWGRRESLCEAINTRHENPDYLPGLRLPDAITATHDPAAAADGAEAVVLAVPSQSLRENLTDWAGVLPNAVPLVSLMKGVEVGTTKRMSEVIAELTGAGPERIAVVSGPNLAREIAEGQPAAAVVACADEGTADPAAEAVPLADVPPVHEQRRDRLRARRRDQERDRAGRRDGGRPRLRRQRPGVGDHPRPGGDRPARYGARRGRAHVLRAWPAWVTWSRPARRRCRATGPSARSSARA